MIDVLHIENYRENNRIEAKRALGGLPKSLWETYSAFANTLGGVILLGVEEHKDKSLHPVNLPDPERLIAEFWEIMNHSGKVSVNILSAAHVAVEVVNGNRIIVITVPRAERYDKPVFIDKDPFSGSYRRNGEGDYKCTKEEVEAMFRDAAMETQDMELLEAMT
ncbi:MAG: helix-turn-helix domain-containing protein, partial [Lachnospiraceae bacterium]